MSGLSKSVVSWPLTGGLATDTNPLTVQPGSHLTLDDVRQERTNEWRGRSGHTNDTTADAVPGALPPLRAVATPGGSILAMARDVAGLSSARVYQPGLVATSSRWTTLPQGTGQLAPGCWSRIPVGDQQGTATTNVRYVCATSGNYVLTAWILGTATTDPGIKYALTDLATGDVRSSGTIAPIGGSGFPYTQIACAAAGGRLCVFACDISNRLSVTTWNSSTGALLSSATVLISTANAANPQLDALTYSGSSTITVVYANTTPATQFIEYNPVTGALTTSVALAFAVTALALLPDPDALGTRFVALSTATEVRVLRVDSAGTILFNDLAETATASQIAGCAYQTGTGWMIVYRVSGTVGLRANKRRNGVTGAAITAFSANPITYLYLDTNAWREPSTDAMRVIIGLHGSTADPQHTFFEMGFVYEDGSANVTNWYPEPQARLMPLNGYLAPGAGPRPQVHRLSADKFLTVMGRLSKFSQAGDAASQASVFGIDRWTVEYLNTTNVAALNQGPGTTSADAAYLPLGNLTQTANGAQVVAHGTSAIPFVPVLTPSTGAGALGLLKTYQYVTTVEVRDERGGIWESPPSIAASVVLTGTQNTIDIAAQISAMELPTRRRTIKLWRTKGDGSIFQLVTKVATPGVTSIAYTDLIADTALNSAEFLSLEIPATITPAASHVELFGGRLWVADRDFTSQLWFSKKIQENRAPVFVGAFQLSLSDSEGPITNMAAMDDKLVVFKASAVYVIYGDGPDSSGAGNFPVVLRVDTDIGAKVGTPVVSTGSEVYFVADRGIHRMNRALKFDWVGLPVDRYLNQPLVQTQEVITGAVFSPAEDEVRFQTTNYRLIYDRVLDLWIRDTGAGMQNVVRTVMVGSKQVLFKSNGDMWFEGAATQTTDAGTTYTPIIRTAWIRPSGIIGQRMRLYQARLVMARTTGGGNVTPTMRIYYDNDDSIFESFSPSAVIGGAATLINGSAQPRRHRCQSFSLEARLPTSDVTIRLDAWAAEVGMKRGAFKNGAAERWV